jgi:hypothetical protein
MADIKLFEQTENTNPNTLQRLGFGRAGQPTENMTLANFLTWLGSRLTFLSKAQNLADLPNKTTSRTNLGVYSTSQVDSALNAKANIYPTSGGALKTNNTSSFTPSADYHPATKKYVDDNLEGLLFKGYSNIGDPGSLTEKTINLGTTLSTSSYHVVGEMYDLANPRKVQDIVWGTFSHGTTSFGLVMRELSSNVQNLRFYFRIYDATAYTLCTNS